MGMFDSLTCKYPLPEPGESPDGFQTKDLECLLQDYEITKDGRLMKHEWELEETPKSERPYPDASEDSILSFAGMIRQKEGSHKLVDMNYHGMLNFHGMFRYRAKFTDGQVVEIVRVAKR